jgi:hypothetical protein
MKKLMTAAAAVALAAATQAGIVVNTNCNPRSITCPVVAFKVTANGKIAAPAAAGDYKTATKLSVKKGALVVFPTTIGKNPYTQEDECCYDNYSLYLKVKIGKMDEVPVGVFFEQLDSWSIFGKNYNKLVDAEKAKKSSVESEIGLSYANTQNGVQGTGVGVDTVTDSTGTEADLGEGLADFAFIATAFGKGTYGYVFKQNKPNACKPCEVTANYYEFTPGSYSGWFAGLVTDFGGDYGCLMCNCADIDVFGGTWKAKYDKNWSKTSNGWYSAASYVFGAGVAADMAKNDVE